MLNVTERRNDIKMYKSKGRKISEEEQSTNWMQPHGQND